MSELSSEPMSSSVSDSASGASDTGSSAASSSMSTGVMSAHDALALADSSPAESDASSSQSSAPLPVAQTQVLGIDAHPDSVPVEGGVKQPGPVPYDRFSMVNRQKNELTEQLKQYESLQGMGAEDVASVTAWARMLNADPVAAWSRLQEALSSDARYADQVQHQIASRSGAARETAIAPTAHPEPMPTADLQAEDGTLVYSAPQMEKWQNWKSRELMEQFQQQIAPLQEMATSVRQQEALAQAWNEVSHVLTEFRADPGFAQHEHAIKAMLSSDHRLAALSESDPRMALEMAYNRVWRTTIAPTQQRQAESTVLENLQRRAVAGTVNPSSAGTTMPRSSLGNARAALEAAFAE